MLEARGEDRGAPVPKVTIMSCDLRPDHISQFIMRDSAQQRSTYVPRTPARARRASGEMGCLRTRGENGSADVAEGPDAEY